MRKGHSYPEHHNTWSKFGSVDENEQATKLHISNMGIQSEYLQSLSNLGMQNLSIVELARQLYI
jgi:hypothetical protein